MRRSGLTPSLDIEILKIKNREKGFRVELGYRCASGYTILSQGRVVCIVDSENYDVIEYEVVEEKSGVRGL